MDAALHVSRRRLLGAAALLPMSLPAPAQAADRLDQALAALLAEPSAPLASLSVLVRRGGRVVYERAFGRRHIGPPGADLPANGDTLFRMASVSKLVTALGALRLADAGRLDLDADIGALLGYPVRHPQHPDRPLTARLLMSHRSGLADPGSDYTDGRLQLSQRFATGKTWHPHAPGAYFQYANFNFVVLAALMELAAGERFDRLMQRWVLGPLGMQGGFDPSRLPAEQVATLYRKAPSDAGPWDPAGRWHAQADDLLAEPARPPLADGEAYVVGSRPALFAPQGGLRTRVRDLGQVMAMLLDPAQSFLKPASRAAMTSELWRSDGGNEGSNEGSSNGDTDDGLFQAWGLGLQHFIDRSRPHQGDRVLPQGGVQAWGHLGFAYGLVSGLLVAPERGCGIAYVIGGTGDDPARHPGIYSSFPTWEERVQALLWTKALGR